MGSNLQQNVKKKFLVNSMIILSKIEDKWYDYLNFIFLIYIYLNFSIELKKFVNLILFKKKELKFFIKNNINILTKIALLLIIFINK